MDEAKAIRDKAEAVRMYAKSARLELGVQNLAAMIKILAEQRAGALIGAMERVQGARDGRKGLYYRLKESEIDPVVAYRWQIMARVPEATIRELEAPLTAEGAELTSALIYRHGGGRAGHSPENRLMNRNSRLDVGPEKLSRRGRPESEIAL